MIGAIIGDVVGSRFEWNNIKTKEFEFFTDKCFLTDDSIMTLAVGLSLAKAKGDYSGIADSFVENMQVLGNKYPNAGYGGRFIGWLMSDNPKPYNSFGNGSGMRVSPVVMYAESLEEALFLAEESAKVTHNHEEGIKGAKAIAGAAYLAKAGKSKEEIRQFINDNFYTLDFTIDEIRPTYTFDVTCMGSVPQAIEAFLESESFEDAVRTAISIGGDSDTVAAMTGAIAEHYYGVPKETEERVLSYFDDELTEIYNYITDSIK